MFIEITPLRRVSILGIMALNKISETAVCALYKVSVDNNRGVDFYVQIDKEGEDIRLYLDQTLSTPVYVANSTNYDQPIKPIPGLYWRAILFSITRSMTMRESKTFPEVDSFCSCSF
jgi:hypothetical protein